ncbi:MAG: hypothetical protein ACE5WD_09685, partial [Candidatus Aminicenantia bacterium]
NQTAATTLDSYISLATTTIVTDDTKRYSKDPSTSTLPTDNSDLPYYLDYKGYDAVATATDGKYDPATSTSAYPVFLFARKHTNSTDSIDIDWRGQTTQACSVSNKVVLQVYNISQTRWDGLATSTNCLANTDFDLETTIATTSAGSYYDTNNWNYVRVYQDSGSQTLKTDYISIAINEPPQVSDISLNNGQNIDLTENTTTLVTSTATTSDPNGWEDIISVIGKIFRSGVGQDCATNTNNCYETTCATSSCSGTSCIATCDFNVQFHADPTVTDTPWDGQNWVAWIKATDSQSQSYSATNTTQTIKMNDLTALDIAGAPIYYGFLYPTSTTDPLTTTTQVINTGNCSLDVTLYGINMTSNGNSISVTQQKYATSSVAYGSPYAYTLQLDPGQELELNLPKTIDAGNKQTTDIYWGIQIPDPQPTGDYSGQNTLTGSKNELPWP